MVVFIISLLVTRRLRESMLVIANLTAKSGTFPVEALKEVDAALVAAGFKKEVHSVVKPGIEYSLTYEGPSMEKIKVEDIVRPPAERNQISFTIELEESVRFP